MSVSARHIAAAALTLAWSGAAAAQSGPCCTGGQQVVTAPSVSIAGPTVNVGAPSVSTTIHGGSVTSRWSRHNHRHHGGQVIIAGGGSRCCGAAATAPSTVNSLTVVGETVAYETRTREIRELAAVRAVCLDADGNPHPASRPSADERVAASFNGEIYRCMAGTTMQTSVGTVVDGAADFSGGETIVCGTGEALRYADGALACATQEPRRNCHERSLLRRYGPGVKIVELVRVERFDVPVPSAFEHAGGPIVFDGGVGGGAACGGC